MKDTRCDVCDVSMERYSTWVFRCQSCGFWKSDLEPGGGTDVEGLGELRRVNFETLLDRLGNHIDLTGADLLEVGPAYGWFLEAARRRGATLAAIEPDESKLDRIRENSGVAAEHGFFPGDLKNRGPFDCIIFNDVFEHIPAPATLIPEIEQLLKPGGLLIINCPSSDGIFYRLALVLDKLGMRGPFERLWQKGFASPHLTYFNPETLDRLVETHSGMERAERFRLETLSRKGLYRRLANPDARLPRVLIFVPVYLLSFLLGLFKPDIQVAFFRSRS